MNWKPQEITKEQYNEINMGFAKQAIRLAIAFGTGDYSNFYSSVGAPRIYCYVKLPKSFNIIAKELTVSRHFMPFPCNSEKATMANKEDVICLCITMGLGGTKYYLHTHRIGRCPWKKRVGE